MRAISSTTEDDDIESLSEWRCAVTQTLAVIFSCSSLPSPPIDFQNKFFDDIVVYIIACYSELGYTFQESYTREVTVQEVCGGTFSSIKRYE
jgi:hypothetical protein